MAYVFCAFNSSKEACDYSNVDNLGRLQRGLNGAALEAVRSRSLLSRSVPQIRGKPSAEIRKLVFVSDHWDGRAKFLRTFGGSGISVASFEPGATPRAGR